MKCKLLNILLLLNIFVFQTFAQDSLSGNHIISCTEIRYDYKFGVINDTAGVLVSEQFYNISGKVENLILYYINGMVYKIIKYKYDQNNNPVEKLDYYSNGTLSLKTVNYFDDNTRFITASDEYYPSGDVYKYHKFINDSLGNVIRDDTYFANGNKYSSIVHSYKYNAAGKITEQISYNELGFLISIYTYKYNSEGYLIEKKLYNNVKEPVSLFKYFYR